MLNYLAAIGIILVMLFGWVAVQHLSRKFAAKHPEFGPVRDEGGGCGGFCGCVGTRCAKEEKK